METKTVEGGTVFRMHATSRRAREVLELLAGVGVGIHFGSVEIQEVKSTVPKLSNHPRLITGVAKARGMDYKVSGHVSQVHCRLIYLAVPVAWLYLSYLLCGVGPSFTVSS